MSSKTTSCVVVCVKWTLDEHQGDDRFSGLSPADQAALELGLRTGEATGDDVVVVSAGPSNADKILREALACGATRAVRIETPRGISSCDAARAVARVVTEFGPIRLVWCGDYSPDRGSGSFPAFLAGSLSMDQALGLIRVEFDGDSGERLDVVRRLDGGRRERSIVTSGAVLSVEGSLVRLRRASLSGALAAQSRPVDVVESHLPPVDDPVLKPYRPRARSFPSPRGESPLERFRSVTETASPSGRSDPVVLDPARAAETIVDRLREWGYVQ